MARVCPASAPRCGARSTLRRERMPLTGMAGNCPSAIASAPPAWHRGAGRASFGLRSQPRSWPPVLAMFPIWLLGFASGRAGDSVVPTPRMGLLMIAATPLGAAAILASTALPWTAPNTVAPGSSPTMRSNCCSWCTCQAPWALPHGSHNCCSASRDRSGGCRHDVHAPPAAPAGGDVPQCALAMARRLRVDPLRHDHLADRSLLRGCRRHRAKDAPVALTHRDRPAVAAPHRGRLAGVPAPPARAASNTWRGAMAATDPGAAVQLQAAPARPLRSSAMPSSQRVACRRLW